MRIGTITFHWATNYGAVLQSFALQQYLKLNGYETEIINYIPLKVKARQIISNIKHVNIDELLKEYRINKFRKNNLVLSREKYYTSSELNENCYDYDLYICGSDQVWNEWFTLFSENKPNLSYYLNFAGSKKARVAYAASFGTNQLSLDVIKLIKPELEKFKNIGV